MNEVHVHHHGWGKVTIYRAFKKTSDEGDKTRGIILVVVIIYVMFPICNRSGRRVVVIQGGQPPLSASESLLALFSGRIDVSSLMLHLTGKCCVKSCVWFIISLPS